MTQKIRQRNENGNYTMSALEFSPHWTAHVWPEEIIFFLKNNLLCIHVHILLYYDCACFIDTYDVYYFCVWEGG